MTGGQRGYVVAIWGDDGKYEIDWAYVGDWFDDDFLRLHTLQGYYLTDGRPTEILEFVPVWRLGNMPEHAYNRCDYWRGQMETLREEQGSCGDI